MHIGINGALMIIDLGGRGGIKGGGGYYVGHPPAFTCKNVDRIGQPHAQVGIDRVIASRSLDRVMAGAQASQ